MTTLKCSNLSLCLHYAVRHEFLVHLGLESVERLVASGGALALSELRLRFLAPLRCGDAFTGTLAVTRAAGARVHMQQQLLREGGAEPQVLPTLFCCCCKYQYNIYLSII